MTGQSAPLGLTTRTWTTAEDLEPFRSINEGLCDTAFSNCDYGSHASITEIDFPLIEVSVAMVSSESTCDVVFHRRCSARVGS